MPLLNILLNIYSKATIKVNELILIRFSPFDIKCKKINTKNLRKCIFRAFGRVSLSYFHTLGHVWVPPDTPQNFRRSYCNIQFNPDAAYKMELFVTINRKQLETVVDCCYKELRLICDSRTNRYIQVQTTKYSVQHLHAQSPHKNTRNVSNIFKFNNKDTRTSFASIVNFEHISHFILLLLVLNSNKYMLLGSERIYTFRHQICFQ